MNFKIHHIGYLVKNIEKASKLFLTLGYQVEQDTVYDNYRGVDIRFLNKDGYRVELVAPPQVVGRRYSDKVCSQRAL